MFVTPTVTGGHHTNHTVTVLRIGCPTMEHAFRMHMMLNDNQQLYVLDSGDWDEHRVGTMSYLPRRDHASMLAVS